MTKTRWLGLAFGAVWGASLALPAMAGPGCTIIVDAKSGEVLVQDGPCGTRESPASTFKIALSLMGYDSGALVDARTPARPYKDEYRAMMESWKVTTDPTIWMEDSVVWYSQVLTREMGSEKFADYVARFNYGNGDISGDPGRNNGLTNAWLGSSLLISPAEEVGFIRRMLAGQLGVSKEAIAKTKAIMPSFPADDDWTVYGKTGSGLLRATPDYPKRDRQFGWFVGWATKGSRTIAFAALVRDDEKKDDRAGVRLRGQFIERLPALMSAARK
ncbi:MAG: class D beta-lactamase [Rhodospirillaceae bacterium]|nr:class D beta-lactamase [Rhodospirillaceae bacterium]